MAVAFTPNIGLAKPDETELAENWVNSSQLQDDNNLIIINKTDIVLTSYTPVLAAQTTAPSVGAGTIKGEYQDIEGIIMGGFAITIADPGVTAGVGEIAISLPFPADGSYHSVGTTFNANPGAFTCIGEAYLLDIAGPNTSGCAALDVTTVAGVSYARFVTETFVGKTNRLFAPGQPFSFANLSKICGSFIYKRA